MDGQGHMAPLCRYHASAGLLEYAASLCCHVPELSAAACKHVM